LRVKPAKERTLELVKTVDLEYWGTTFKGMEQPKESDGNVTLYADGGKKGNSKKAIGRSSRAIATTAEFRGILLVTDTTSRKEWRRSKTSG